MHSSHKRLIYVRCSDNVYRRKGSCGSSNSDHAGLASSNELTALGFRLAEPSTAIRSALSDQHSPKHSPDENFASYSSLPETASVSTAATDLLSNSFSPNPDQSSRPAPHTPSMDAEEFRFPQFRINYLQKNSVPFILGMLTMYVLGRSKPLILHYVNVCVGILKMLLLCGIISGGALWFFGKISSETIDILILKITSSNVFLPSLSGPAKNTGPNLVNSISDHPEKPPKPPTHRTRELPRKSNSSEHEIKLEETNVRPFVTPLRQMIAEPKLKLTQGLTRAEDEPSSLKSGRSSLTKVTLINQRRDSASLLDLANRLRKPYSVVRAKTAPNAELPLV